MNPTRRLITLDEFTIHQLRQFPTATGELSGLLRDLGLAAKRVHAEVNKAGLGDILGDAGRINVQGEEVKKLDLFANNQFIRVLQGGIHCAGFGSEENEDVLIFDDELSNQAKYVVLMDPLDGSGNIDTNVSIGTIFSVFRRLTPLGGPCSREDFLQPGSRQVAAGYILYGSSTMMVYATKAGVNGFTLDPSIGEFCLSHRDMTCPSTGRILSMNMGYLQETEPWLDTYVRHCMRPDPEAGKPYTFRYIGSMLADVHRNLIKGGIYVYPPIQSKPKGKLRLLYECNPMAYIVEAAGGMALMDAHTRILDVPPQAIHQRVPLYIGSSEMVKEVLDFMPQG